MTDEISIDERSVQPDPSEFRTSIERRALGSVGQVAVGDGRQRRRRRNVDSVLDAVVSLAGEGNLDPTSEEIAERAGVSHRSIYRYFESRRSLLEAAIAKTFEEVAPTLFFSPLGEGPLEERIARFVEARVGGYRAFRDIARAAFSRIGDPEVAHGVDVSRAALRAQLAEQFAPELSAIDVGRRQTTLLVIDSAFQFESLEYMATSGELGDDEIRIALASQLRAHLS